AAEYVSMGAGTTLPNQGGCGTGCSCRDSFRSAQAVRPINSLPRTSASRSAGDSVDEVVLRSRRWLSGGLSLDGDVSYDPFRSCRRETRRGRTDRPSL